MDVREIQRRPLINPSLRNGRKFGSPPRLSSEHFVGAFKMPGTQVSGTRKCKPCPREVTGLSRLLCVSAYCRAELLLCGCSAGSTAEHQRAEWCAAVGQQGTLWNTVRLVLEQLHETSALNREMAEAE